MYKYYVSYTYGMSGSGCYHAQLDEPLETYDQVLALATQIATERQHDSCVIQNWKKLQ